MAKESMKAREVKRAKLCAKYAEKRKALKAAGDYAGLDKKVVVAGLYNRIEIWDEDKWNKYNKENSDHIGDIAEGLKEFEI